MRRTRIVALAALVVVTVSGCSATTAPPVGPSEAELNERVHAELDRQWKLTGLDGIVPRPEVEVEKISSIDGFSEEFGQCMTDAGFTGWGVSEAGLDMASVNPDGAATTPEQQLAYYGCTARFPGVDKLSVAQMDFVYDYYQRWLIPCIEQQGYEVIGAPSRDDFYASREQTGWQWSPYSGLTHPPTTNEGYASLQRACRPTIPGIDGWSEQFSLF